MNGRGGLLTKRSEASGTEKWVYSAHNLQVKGGIGTQAGPSLLSLLLLSYFPSLLQILGSSKWEREDERGKKCDAASPLLEP